MVSLTCSTQVADGVTLVTARLDGGPVPQRVRLANRLDGPVWPPRREGVPEEGWNGDGFETVVPTDGTVVLGYASPAPPVDAPLAFDEREVHSEERTDGSVSPADAIRALGDPSPPRDAIPIPVDERGEDGDDGEDDEDGEVGDVSDPAIDPNAVAAPNAVEAWLDAVEERVTTAERLASAETVPAVTDALREAGSLADAEGLVEDLRTDADALETASRRTERLAARADDVDVPLATLERLA